MNKAILVTGSHEFFVEEAAEELRASLATPETDVERISDEDLAERLPIALTHGSLFAQNRLVDADLSGLFGRESPASLVDEAVEAWNKGTPAGRREAFKKVRALLSALRIQGSPEEAGPSAARKARRADAAETLTEILRELPGRLEDAAPALSAVLAYLERGLEGTILVARAVDPPKTSALYQAFKKLGSIQDVASRPEEFGRYLASRAKKLAAEKDVAMEPAAVETLLRLTESDPRRFDSELEKVLGWAESGGKVRSRDVEALVADGRSEDLYAFFDALGARDRVATFQRLDRILSGRALRAGDKEVKGDDPLRAFLGMLVAEVRRLLVVRARCEETRTKIEPAISFATYQTRVHPRLCEPAEPFSFSLLESSPYLWYKCYQRAAKFSSAELEAKLIACAEADEATKDSAPLAESLAVLVGTLV
ncbi:MAG: DNA polymerase III subunit delta [Thermoanaerobaculia bacterium]